MKRSQRHSIFHWTGNPKSAFHGIPTLSGHLSISSLDIVPQCKWMIVRCKERGQPLERQEFPTQHKSGVMKYLPLKAYLLTFYRQRLRDMELPTPGGINACVEKLRLRSQHTKALKNYMSCPHIDESLLICVVSTFSFLCFCV